MFHSQTNLALGKTVTSSAGGSSLSNLVDGNFNTAAITGNAAVPPNAEYFLVDLGEDYIIDNVTLGSVTPDNGRSRRFMLITYPSTVGGNLGFDPNAYVSATNTCYLYNRLIYTDPAGVVDSNTVLGGGSVPAVDNSKRGPVFPGGQINMHIGKHKARYVLILNLQDDNLQFTELQVYASPTPAVRTFVNGGFELDGAGMPREGDVRGWSTTEAAAMTGGRTPAIPTQGSLIEYWSNGQQEGGSPVLSSQGSFWAELNAYTNGMLEQEPICVLPGESFTWSFLHRGRNGVDVMGLRIDDQNVAEFSDNNAQSGTHSFTQIGSNSINTGLTQSATDVRGWTRYTGTWNNTSGVAKTVIFSYYAKSTAGGPSAIGAGNFIDDVRITSLNSIANLSTASSNGLETIPSANLPKITINGNVPTAQTVQINITGGTATRGVDYTTTPATGLITVTIPAGNYDGTDATAISLAPYIQINQDNITEPNGETIEFSIQNSTGNVLIAPASGCFTRIVSATYTIIDPVADLSIVKTVNNATPNSGSPVTFSIVVTNNGPDAAAGVSVNDVIPSGYTYQSASAPAGTTFTYTATTSTLVWNIGNLANGASTTLTITALTNSSGNYTNTATVGGNVTDPVSGNNSSSVSTTPVIQNECMGSTATKLNLSGGVLISGTANTVGAKYKYSNVIAGTGVTQQADIVFELTALDFGSPLLQSNYDFVFDATQSTAGIENNFQPSFVRSTSGLVNNIPTGTYHQSSTWKATVYKAGTTTPYNVPTIIQVIDNDGSTSATIDVFESVEFLSPLPAQIITSTPTTQVKTGNVVKSNGTPQAGIGVDPQYSAYGNYGYANEFSFKLDNEIVIKGSPSINSNLGNRFASVNFGCDFSGTNNFTKQIVSGTVYTDTDGGTPSGMPYINGNVYANLVDPNGNIVASQVASTVNGSYSFSNVIAGTYKVLLTNTAQTVGSVAPVVSSLPPNYVNVTSTDATPTDGITTVTVAAADITGVNFGISNSADLKVIKSSSNATPNVGSTITFTITATNDGPLAATGATVTDLLPSGYAYQSFTATAGTYTPATGVWAIGNLANGSSATLTITATVNTTGSYANTATVTGNESDTNLANNSSTSTPVPVNPPATPIFSIQQPCTTNTGTLTVNTPLGTDFTYSIDGVNYQTSPIFTGLTTGTYNVTVKSISSTLVSMPNIATILSFVDSDGDGYADACDLDDDNDGILDSNEGCDTLSFNAATMAKSLNGTPIPNGVFTTLSVNDVVRYGNFFTFKKGTQIDLLLTIKDVKNITDGVGAQLNPSGELVIQARYDQSPFIVYDLSFVLSGTTTPFTIPGRVTQTFKDLDSNANDDVTEIVGIKLNNGYGSIDIGSELEFGGFIPSASNIPTNYTYVRLNPAFSGNPNNWFDELPANPSDVQNHTILNFYNGFSSGTYIHGATGSSVFNGRRGIGVLDFNFVDCVDTDGDGTVDSLDLDSDNDGCFDAIEGDENVQANQLNANGSINITISGGVNTNGIPNLVNSGGLADIGGDIGQGKGSSSDALVSTCVCYEPPTDVTSSVPVKHGITLLGRAGADNGNWPMLRNSAYTALESKNKGLVITRNSNPEGTITNPVVGMMVFDTDENAGKGCMKIYTGSGVGEGWKCFNTQTCP